jgi:lysophospholipase L1-like esterase
MKLVVVFFLIALVVLVVELGLRCLGFGNPLIYLGDAQIGYLLAPNQTTRRWGNRMAINGYSMRSDPVRASRSAQTFRVLMIGDSIVNGGWWTDQRHLISERLKQDLQTELRQRTGLLPIAPSVTTIEVLNASANSWGPRNELAYLERFGCFEAQLVVLVINTDDLFATAPTALPVGHDRNYPAHKPLLAIGEAITRLLPASPLSAELRAVQAEPGDRVGFNLAAITTIHTLVQQSSARLLLIMTPLLRELTPPGSRDYEVKARQRLMELTQTADIPYLDFLPIFQATPDPTQLYHDHIHLNVTGNRWVSQQIQQWLRSVK